MPALAIRFPGRRYHATPWGHHVNEGLVEWPPSPWRLLRALLATGHTKLGWREIPRLGRSLIEKLASVLPRYQLPKASMAHSRHYMPAPVTTTLVFDTWAQLEDGALLLDWSVELEAEESDLLAVLATRLSYLGRSESWVDARLLAGSPFEPNAFPCDGSPNPGPGWEQVSLLAAEPAPAYTLWREDQVARLAPLVVAAPGEKTKRKQSAKASAKVEEERIRREAAFPTDLLACLGVDTTWLQEHGWSQPPASRRVLYWRRADSLDVGAPRRRSSEPQAKPVACILLALATESGRTGALPPVVRALPQARLLHRAFAQRSERESISAVSRRALLGVEADGGPAQTDHNHAHVLPLDLDADGRLEHVLVWAKLGLDADAQRVLHAVRKTYAKGVAHDLQVTVVAEGSLADVSRIGDPHRSAMARVLGGENSRIWVSATPFFTPRHVKRRGRHTLEGQLQEELHDRGLPSCRAVEVLERDELIGRRFLHFVRRDPRMRPPVDVPLGLRLHFDEAVAGPLCLGFGSHYGLGRFETVAEP
ncbi:type I-U CRISPR-associated protein Cas5/Cas6 [bacterium]|nr:type I-U CRISPR-associated protein Cas5/Cas6 [bacterium]